MYIFLTLKKRLLFCASVLLSCAVQAQTSSYYPDFLTVYYYNMATVNPGYVPQEGVADISLGYKISVGPLKDVSTLAFAASKIWGQGNTNCHVGRILAYNAQEGPYITYPRAYGNYAYLLRISENTSAYAGVAAGGAGIYFSAPSATTSIFLPDGSLGLGLYHRKISLGAASMQMLNRIVTPLLATLRFTRYYQFHFDAEADLSWQWKWKSYALWRYLPDVQDELIGTTTFVYEDLFTLGSAYRYRAGLALFTSFRIRPEKNSLLISFAYNSPFFSNVPRLQNSMEIGLRYLVE